MSVILALLITQAAAATSGSDICQTLATDWRRMNENAAERAISNSDRNDELRKIRQLADISEASRAQLTYQIMKDQGCSLPKRAVGPYLYLRAATACQIARDALNGAESPLCDRTRWKEGE